MKTDYREEVVMEGVTIYTYVIMMYVDRLRVLRYTPMSNDVFRQTVERGWGVTKGVAMYTYGIVIHVDRL